METIELLVEQDAEQPEYEDAKERSQEFITQNRHDKRKQIQQNNQYYEFNASFDANIFNKILEKVFWTPHLLIQNQHKHEVQQNVSKLQTKKMYI